MANPKRYTNDSLTDSNGVSRKLRHLFVLLVFLVPAMSLFVAYMLYNAGLEQQKVWLMKMLESQVDLIESVACFDAIHSERDHSEGAQGATISQVRDAFRGRGFGDSGEFVFAKFDSGKIRFLFPPKFHRGTGPLILDESQEVPMREALLGRTGVGTAVDYRGVEVLAAYAFVPSLQSGIVAKIDLAELRRPYLEAFIISIGVSAAVFLLGISIFLKITADIRSRFEAQLKAEEEVKDLRVFLSNIINSMPSVLVGIDRELNVTHWNKGAEIMTEVPSEDAIGKSLSEVFPQSQLNLKEVQESIDTSTVRYEANVLRQAGKDVRYEDVTVYPLVANGVNGAVLRIDDVTERHDMEQQFNQSSKLDAIGQLAGGIAHDFNNMLSGIMGAADLLQASIESPRQREYVNMIQQAAQQSADLTTKLLAFGRKGDAAHEPTDIHTVIDDTVTILAHTVDKKVIITANKDAQNHIVMGDASRIQNSLINLGINSSNSIKDGGEIEISTTNVTLDKGYCDASPFDIDPGEYVQIDVKDDGCGILPENLDRLFEPFFTTTETGTGLGLAAVYGTVKSHRGAITVYSEEGQGTVFHIYLPCRRSTSDAGDTSQGRSRKQEPESLLQGSGTILLVDDELIIRRVGKGMLESMGYSVLVAEDGSEAVDIFQKRHSEIDLVILDMIMPKMNGREAFIRMMDIDSQCRILISSGFWKEKDIQELTDKGLAGFIRKPFTGAKLSQAIKDILDS